MRLPELIPGELVARDNRFRATVALEASHVAAHVANSGRLGELLTPGRRVWLAPSQRPGRRTAYDLALVEHAGVLVSADARLPNRLVAEALAAGELPGLDYPAVAAEVRLGDSRLDFRLSGPAGRCWLEVKSVTLVEAGVALFPDAPTARGLRHLAELVAAVRAGDRAAVVFVVQRPDAERFKPHWRADPDFAAALVAARAAGVAVRAFVCQVTLASVAIGWEIPA